jgi:hypothetical protein
MLCSSPLKDKATKVAFGNSISPSLPIKVIFFVFTLPEDGDLAYSFFCCLEFVINVKLSGRAGVEELGSVKVILLVVIFELRVTINFVVQEVSFVFRVKSIVDVDFVLSNLLYGISECFQDTLNLLVSLLLDLAGLLFIALHLLVK